MPRSAPSRATAPRTGILALLVALACLALTLHSHSQSLAGRLSDQPSPPAPATLISDNADLFSRDPATLRELSEKLTTLKSRHGFSLYFIIEPVLIASTPNDLATTLQQAWLPDGGGFVVVFESDTRRLGFGRANSNAADVSRLASQLPSYEVLTILGKSLQEIDTTQPPETILTTLITSLASGFDQAFLRRNAPPPRGRTLRMALVAIGGISMLALGTLGLGWVLRRSRSETSLRRRFIDVDVPERLGAPYGGGLIVSRRFRGSAPPHS